MKLEVGKSQTIDEGKYEAQITKVERRTEPYDYTDYWFTLETEGAPLVKHGFPSDVKIDQKGEPTTSHAKFLKKMGIVLEKEIDTDELIGKRVSLMIANEETAKGTFARVVDKFIKPL